MQYGGEDGLVGEGLRVPGKAVVAGNDGVLRSKFLNQKA